MSFINPDEEVSYTEVSENEVKVTPVVEDNSSEVKKKWFDRRHIIAGAVVVCFLAAVVVMWSLVGTTISKSSKSNKQGKGNTIETVAGSNKPDGNKNLADKGTDETNGSKENESTDAGSEGESTSGEAGSEAGSSSGGNSGSGGGGSSSGSSSGGSSGGSKTVPSGPLHVSGTQLVDAGNNPVQLKGVSTHGIQWGEMYPYVNEDVVRTLHDDWGANVFRIAMYVEEGGYLAGANQDNLKKIIDNGVTYATNNGMYVIIDWHVLNYSPDRYTEQAKKFFAEMAQKYADHDNVIYEICNEPVGAEWNSHIKPYAEAVIPSIRQYDKDAVIIVGTNTWSQDVDAVIGNELSDPNVMYAFHFYAATHKDDLRNKVKKALNAGIPIFISECSICDASGNGGIDYSSAETWLNFINENNLSYVAWSICNKNESASLISPGCSKMGDWTDSELSATGKWFKNAFLTGSGSSGGSSGSSGGSSSSGGGSGSSGGSSGSSSGDSGSSGGSSGGATTPVEIPFVVSETTPGGLSVTSNTGGPWSESGKTKLQYVLTVENKTSSTVSDWVVKIQVPEGTTIVNKWCCQAEISGNMLIVKPESWNSTISAGGNQGGLGIEILY
ncbi:MAG: cellulase family glycosylhydrolase [Lachnospira sp.]